jgi:hypothetical protein
MQDSLTLMIVVSDPLNHDVSSNLPHHDGSAFDNWI